MIGSISIQPDIKLYLTQQEIVLLKERNTVHGRVWSHISKTKNDIGVLIDDSLLGGATLNPERTVVQISSTLFDELSEKGFIGGLRMNGMAQKLILVVRERIPEITDPDMRLNLEWGLESLEQKMV